MFAISFGLHRAALLLAEHFALFLIQSEVNKKKKEKKRLWFGRTLIGLLDIFPSVVIVQGDCDTPYWTVLPIEMTMKTIPSR